MSRRWPGSVGLPRHWELLTEREGKRANIICSWICRLKPGWSPEAMSMVGCGGGHRARTDPSRLCHPVWETRLCERWLTSCLTNV